MKMPCITRTAAVTVLMFLCGGCQLMDMVRFSYDNARSSYSWADGKHETTVPFTVIDNHVILPVRVNGGEPMNFVLDSGAAATVIMDSRRTRSLALESSSQITVSGVGAGPDPVAARRGQDGVLLQSHPARRRDGV